MHSFITDQRWECCKPAADYREGLRKQFSLVIRQQMVGEHALGLRQDFLITFTFTCIYKYRREFAATFIFTEGNNAIWSDNIWCSFNFTFVRNLHPLSLLYFHLCPSLTFTSTIVLTFTLPNSFTFKYNQTTDDRQALLVRYIIP